MAPCCPSTQQCLEFVASHNTVPTYLPGFSFLSSDLHTPFPSRSYFSVQCVMPLCAPRGLILLPLFAASSFRSYSLLGTCSSFKGQPRRSFMPPCVLFGYYIPTVCQEILGETQSLSNIQLLNSVLADDGKWDWQVEPGYQ